MGYKPVNWENFPSTKTPVTAENLKHMDTQIKDNADAIEVLKSKDVTIIYGQLAAGSTEINFTSDKFKSNSLVSIFSEPYGYSPLSVTETASNSINTKWKAVSDKNVKITLKIENFD